MFVTHFEGFKKVNGRKIPNILLQDEMFEDFMDPP